MEYADKTSPFISFSCTEVKYGAWKYFLPLDKSQNIMVIESSLGLDTISVVPDFEHITTVSFNKASTLVFKSRFNDEQLRNITIIETSPDCLPFKEISFDLIILRDSDSFFTSTHKPSNVKLFEEIVRVLKPSGIALIGFSNKKAIQLYKTITLYKQKHEIGLLLSYLKMNGFSINDVIYTLPGRFSIYEITSRRFVPFRTDSWWTIKRYIKNYLLHNWIHYLTSSNMYVMSRNRNQSNHIFIDQLLNKIIQRYGDISDNFIIKKVIVGNPNVLICLIASEKCKLVARIPIDEVSLKRLKNQVDILSHLNRNLPEGKEYLPRQYESIHISGHKVFLEEMIEGIVVGNLNKVYTEEEKVAVEWLKAFHKSTCEKTFITESIFDELINTPLHNLLNFIKSADERQVLLSLRDLLRKRFIGALFPLVCMHGDFKIENIIFGKRSRSIKSVIDWDLAKLSGLSGVDLIYFLAYSFTLRNPSATVSHVIIEKICKNKITEFERKIIYTYLDQLGIDHELLPFLGVLSWLHHVVYRSKDLALYWDTWYRTNVSNILNELNAVFLQ
ncbi:MAG: methyltransferase domain-containing protein [Bacteroidales bacterium]|nr:methyltransferase domain-containing protein [Bacteroidales bacterium]